MIKHKGDDIFFIFYIFLFLLLLLFWLVFVVVAAAFFLLLLFFFSFFFSKIKQKLFGGVFLLFSFLDGSGGGGIIFFFFFFFLTSVACRPMNSLFFIGLLHWFVCECVCGKGGEGGYKAHSLDVLRAFIIIRNYNNSIIISVIKHTGEDKDNITQYICKQQHPLSNKF